MKILFLINHLNGTDGWSRYGLDLIQIMQKQGHAVLCLTNQKSDQTTIPESVVLHNLLRFANPILFYSTSRRVKKIIQQFKPDIIHFIVEPYINLLPFLRIKNAKTFLTVHGTFSYLPKLSNNFFKKQFLIYMMRPVFQKISGVIAVSSFTMDYLLKKIKHKKTKLDLKTKIKVITNGINLNLFKIADLADKPENQTKQILFVGAIKARKGLLEIIHALNYYSKYFSDNFIFKIVGAYNKNDAYYQELISQIKKYDLENKIIFTGRIDDKELEAAYAKSDLFVMLSLTGFRLEGFGFVYLEANAKGVPCIGSINSGASQAIINNATGYLVEPKNVKEVAEKIDLILNQQKIKFQDCIKWAEQNDIQIKAKEVLNYYQAK